MLTHRKFIKFTPTYANICSGPIPISLFIALGGANSTLGGGQLPPPSPFQAPCFDSHIFVGFTHVHRLLKCAPLTPRAPFLQTRTIHTCVDRLRTRASFANVYHFNAYTICSAYYAHMSFPSFERAHQPVALCFVWALSFCWLLARRTLSDLVRHVKTKVDSYSF